MLKKIIVSSMILGGLSISVAGASSNALKELPSAFSKSLPKANFSLMQPSLNPSPILEGGILHRSLHSISRPPRAFKGSGTSFLSSAKPFYREGVLEPV